MTLLYTPTDCVAQAWDEAVQFCGCIELALVTEEHKSRTCVILRGGVTTSVATTKGRLVEGDQVVVKLMKDPVQFKREITNRKGLSEDSVVMIQASSEDEQLRNRWVDDSRKRGYGEYPCGIVMKAAQRNLMVILVRSQIYQC